MQITAYVSINEDNQVQVWDIDAPGCWRDAKPEEVVPALTECVLVLAQRLKQLKNI